LGEFGFEAGAGLVVDRFAVGGNLGSMFDRPPLERLGAPDGSTVRQLAERAGEVAVDHQVIDIARLGRGWIRTALWGLIAHDASFLWLFSIYPPRARTNCSSGPDQYGQPTV